MPSKHLIINNLLLIFIVGTLLSLSSQLTFAGDNSTSPNKSHSDIQPTVYDDAFWDKIEQVNESDTLPVIEKLMALIIVFEQSKDVYNLILSHSHICINYSYLGDSRGLDHAEKIIGLAQKHDFPILEISGHVCASLHYTDMENFNKAQTSADKALAMANKQPNKISLYNALAALSWLQFSLDDIQGSLSTDLLLLEMAPKVGKETDVGTLLSNIASNYDDLEQYEVALTYYHKSLALTDEQISPSSFGVTLSNMGLSYIRLERYSKAVEVLTRAINFAKKTNDISTLSKIYSNLGKATSRQGKYQQALAYYQSALNLLKVHSGTIDYINVQLGLANSYLSMKRPNDSLKALTKVQPFIEKLNLEYQWLGFYEFTAQAQEQLGLFDMALEAYKKFTYYKFKRQEKINGKDLTQIQVKFDTQQTKKDYNLLQKDNELMTTQRALDHITQLNQQKTTKLMTLIVILTIIIIVIFAIYLMKAQKSREKYRYMAMHDELTKAPNRRAILALADKYLTDSQQDGGDFLLALADIDHFKKFNDSYGHDTGDMVLIQFAQVLSGALRSTDTLGRFGGEEWLIVMPQAKESELELIFSRLQQASKAIHVDGVPADHLISFSMGVASAKGHKGDVDTLVKKADINLYKAKGAGRDQFVI